jgi:CPA2 family monovalent cation:H+ antiporter-2
VAESARSVLSPLRDLFAAVFFVFFGLRTDPTEIPSMLLPAIALAVITAFTKIGVGIWAARRAKIAIAGQIRAGTAIVSRGEFNIVIAGLATGSGIIAPGFAALAAAYVLILAITGPLIARAGEPLGRAVARRVNQRRGRKAELTAQSLAAANKAAMAQAEAARVDPVAPERGRLQAPAPSNLGPSPTEGRPVQRVRADPPAERPSQDDDGAFTETS